MEKKERKPVIMSRDQVRAFDAFAINEIKIPGVVLMENAGRITAELTANLLDQSNSASAAIICGYGNNGGDGFVIARHLLNKGFNVTTILLGNPQKITHDAGINYNALKNMGHKIHEIDPASQTAPENLLALIKNTDIIVDAIFGTGLKGPVRENYCQIFETINSLNKIVVAVDIPSGLDCDTGQILSSAIKANYTVTFAAMKKGLAENKNAIKYTGPITVASIGINPAG
jgi:NAD(P)H-hydrate epimerase